MAGVGGEYGSGGSEGVDVVCRSDSCPVGYIGGYVGHRSYCSIFAGEVGRGSDEAGIGTGDVGVKLANPSAGEVVGSDNDSENTALHCSSY